MKNTRISTRMIIGFTVTIVLAVSVTVIAFIQLRKVSNLTVNLYKHPYAITKSVLSIEGNITAMHRSMKDVTLAEDKEELKVAVAAVNEQEAEAKIHFETLKECFIGDITMVSEVETLFNDWKDIRESVIFLAEKGLKDEAAKITKGESAEHIEKLYVAIEKLEEFSNEKGEEFYIDANKTWKNSYLFLMVAAIVAVVAAVILAVVITKGITNSLRNLSNRISKSSGFVSSSSLQLADAGQTLSQGASEQAASIEETSATMEETASMVRHNAENTREANVLSNEASTVAVQGSDKMMGMTKSMDELNKSSAEIGKIIKVIDYIAFQTNMLALNAAVEAARAGDAGLGFAVVAEEVRNLAQKSADAAKNTTEIIDKNIELSHQGVIISEDVNNYLEEIVTKTESVNALISDIASASEEQAKGTAQVTQAVSQMELVVQQNASSAEESASSAVELQKQANELEGVVSELNLLVYGEKDKFFSIKRENKKEEKNNTNGLQLEATEQIVSSDDIILLDDNSDEF